MTNQLFFILVLLFFGVFFLFRFAGIVMFMIFMLIQLIMIIV